MIITLVSALLGTLIGVGIGAAADKSLTSVNSGFVYLICGGAGAIVGAIAGATQTVVQAINRLEKPAGSRRARDDD